MGCFAFVAPALFFYCLFLVGPIFSTVKISLNEWNGASPYMKWVGLNNYIRVFRDPIFYKALGNNIIWILFTIFIPVLLGLIFAVILTNKWVKGKFLYMQVWWILNHLTWLCPQARLWISRQFGMKIIDRRKKNKDR